MIGIADVYLFDEPTSGLSSKDSEHVIEIIRALVAEQDHLRLASTSRARACSTCSTRRCSSIAAGRWPSSARRPRCSTYFRRRPASEIDRQRRRSGGRGPDTAEDDQPCQPDFIFDVLETPLRDLSGDIIYEEDARGHSSPARRFSPDFWRDRFQAHRLLEEPGSRRLRRPAR